MADKEGDRISCSVQFDGVDSITVGANPTPPSGSARRRRGAMHWLLVICSVVAYVAGTSTVILLSRFYFQNGGNRRWIQAMSQCIGWPLLLLPLMLLKSRRKSFMNTIVTTKFLFICGGLGILSAVDNIAFSWGVSFVSASTNVLLSATQLAFAAMFSYILVRHRITAYVLNSLVLLTLSAILLGVHEHSKPPQGVSSGQYVIGFILTIVASAIFGLILPLMQLFFTKVVGKETFSVVVETQLCVAIVATVITAIGLLASGEFRYIKDEAHSFKSGVVSYYMTLVWTGIGSQISFLGALSLTFLVSSLFSNVINALSLPIVSIMAVVVFKDNMDAIKVISMLLGLWGLASYIFGGYQNSEVSISSATSS